MIKEREDITPMKKRFLAFFLAVCLAITALAVPATAAGNNTAIQTAVSLGGMTTEQTADLSAPLTRGQLARLLTAYCGTLVVHIVPFTEIQEEIRRACPEDHFTLIMRRFMMRIAQAVADRCGAKALVTGECLGQVASQTMEAMAVTRAVTMKPILQPLVGMDKEEIVQIARKIGTFETSILPYEDCCTVFTPRHPRTKPRLEDVEQAESALDIAALVREAVDGVERIWIDIES